MVGGYVLLSAISTVANQLVERMDRALDLVKTMPRQLVPHSLQIEDDYSHGNRMDEAMDMFCVLRCVLLAGAGKERDKGLH